MEVDFYKIRFSYWILCETVPPGQGGVPRLAEAYFTDTDRDIDWYLQTCELPVLRPNRTWNKH